MTFVPPLRLARPVALLLALLTAAPSAAAPRRRPPLAALDSLDARLARAQYAAAESIGLALLAGPPAGARAHASGDSAGIAERVLFAARRNYHEGRPAMRELAERALAIRSAEEPADSLRIAAALEGLAYARSGANDAAGARELGERVLALRSRHLPPEHPEVTRALHNLGSFSYARGRYAEALDYFRRAAEARIRANGEANAEVAYSLNGEASSAYMLDRRAMNDSLQVRILAIRERILPPEHPDRIKSLSAVALSAQALGDLARAEGFARRAVESAEANLPPDHVERAYAYQRLAEVLREQGDYAESRTLHERVVDILERDFGADAQGTLNARHALVLALVFAGDYAEAQRVARVQLDASRRHPSPGHDVAISLDDLAWTQFRLGETDSALVNERAAVALMSAAVGPAHARTVSLLTNLAAMEAGAGHFAVADSLYGRCVEFKAARFGDASPDLANALEGQGAVREAGGDFAGAGVCFEHARRIAETTRPADHPYVGLTLASVARVEFESGRRDSALAHALRAEQIGRDHFRTMAGALAEREALRYAATRVSALDLALTLATDARGLAPPQRRQVWDALIRSRALVLDAMIERRALGRHADPESERLAAALAESRSRHARAALAAADSGAFVRLDSLRREVDREERALAEHSAAFRHRERDAAAGLGEIAAALPRDAALVGFARFERGLDPRSAIEERPRGVPAYAAFVLRAGSPEPAAIPLGDAASIEAAVGAWVRSLSTPPPAEPAAARAAEADCRARGLLVRRLVWDPLVAHIGTAGLVLLVPDGALHTVPLAALPGGSRGYLLESGPTLQVLTTERDVLPSAEPATGRGLLAMGGVDFDRADTARSELPLLAAGSQAEVTYRGARPGCEAFARLRFGSLPGTATEVAEIASTWGAATREGGDDVETGARASEQAFKRLAPGRRILHLATHGFFLDVGCSGAAGGNTRGVLGMVPAQGGAGARASAAGENPLLMSGLALAGANARASAGPNEEDGVLTADEIAALDLSGLEWAVLSACGTGLGELAGPEGVLGLRRAFLAAGARTVFTSLWSVRDEPTREWMTSLYRHRFAEGASTAVGAREAALDVLRARRANGASTHPFEWAAFLAAGDWR
jgi:CHAT domain-containing protein/tetratricopeptide (TPR) repeat protein